MGDNSVNNDAAAVLEFINVSKRYGDVTALRSTDLTCFADKTYVLLGTSGSGKSTLLKVALGLVRPNTGSVRVNGEIQAMENLLRMRRQIGYVIQEGGLFPHLTARDNVTLVARLLRWDHERLNDRIGQLTELTRLPHATMDRYPAELSGGQQQRVGLIRALLLDPELLLMDEPLGALDPITRRELQEDLRRVFRTLKKTVVMVTHDLHEAAFFADEILLMHAGRIVQRGTIRELLDSPAEPFVAEFINAQRTSLAGV